MLGIITLRAVIIRQPRPVGDVHRDSDGPGVRAVHGEDINNQGFGDCFSYKRLNVVISKFNFVTMGLYQLIFG